MIDVILYNDASITRIAQKATKRLFKRKDYQKIGNVIWLNGMYLKFSPRHLVINYCMLENISHERISENLREILMDEEVCVLSDTGFKMYIKRVDPNTEFKIDMMGDARCNR